MTSEPTLDPQLLLARARQITGLDRFDEPLPLESLAALTHALQSEAELTPGGRYYWSERLLGILVTRLRGCEWIRRHPEILQERIGAPIVILGLTRTGTTLLQRLIASDSRFHSAAYWEARFPVPEADDPLGVRRSALARAEIDAMLAANPDLVTVHPFDALDADEDILILDQTLLSRTAETLACIPSYYAWLRTQDLRPAYRYWYRTLQLLQWQKRRRGSSAQRWVLKTPMHLAFVDHIRELLPEATFVQTHRDPLTTIPSYASMVHELWSGVSAAADPLEAAKQTSATLEHDLARCLQVRATLPEDAFIDVDFRDTVTNPLGVIERIYTHVGLGMTDLAARQIRSYMQAHPRDARPEHKYSLVRYGFTEEEIRRRFSAYRRKHIEPFMVV